MPKDEKAGTSMPPGVYTPEEYEAQEKKIREERNKQYLYHFVKESNQIEGIRRDPTQEEIGAHVEFLRLSIPTVEALQSFVDKVQPGAKLREHAGMDVRVGQHSPPKGGPEIRKSLEKILNEMIYPRTPDIAYELHHQYESLHPFMDGNGRSGRVLWLWCMGGVHMVPLGFLHTWYYQSLQFHREG